MMRLWFSRMRRFLQKRFIFCAALLTLACSAACHKAPPPPPSKPLPRPASKPADTKTQQFHYDRGLHAYSGENFEDARTAFLRVIELGPHTSLGLKAQENLRKIQKILKTLEEIQAK